MKVLVLGNGGREHALAWKIGCSGLVEAVFMAPAGSPKEPRIVATALDILDPDAIMAFVTNEGVDLVVIGPEAPLVAGIADSLRASGILVFGPGARGAILEGSKIFAKRFMKEHGIPTADSVVCKTMEEVIQAVEAHDDPYVVKCDGLAAGKGVCVSTSAAQSIDFAAEVFRGSYGEQAEVIMEERLHGQEVSVFALLDGTTYALLAPSRDHKRLKEDDTGPNTGGMGAFTPVPGYSTDLHEQICRSIMDPVMRGLAADKIDYRGLLYVGLILTDDGPKVLEFNC
ncbi:phosphoribosylamine--glycine ligase, partial [Myxococcota bacterium]|nr:phosphoribosylamine--glycine ligase [Myxococcota bacterium]MBU1534400.1 phosphoribosylamine--glycine ligase [Myxococcota bacterium]